MQSFVVEQTEVRKIKRRFFVEAEDEEEAIDKVESKQVDEVPEYTKEDLKELNFDVELTGVNYEHSEGS